MALSQTEKQKVIDWLQTKRPLGFNCSVCNVSRWSVADHLVTSTIFEGGGLQIGGTNYPQAMLICTNCAHTVHFNAVMLGLVK